MTEIPPIAVEELERFLEIANRETYANKHASKVASLRPESEDYHFKRGDLEYHDTYFGSRDFIGSEIVYKQRKPVWGMNYYGYILSPDVPENDLYDFLRQALLQEYAGSLQVRGPQKHVEDVWTYANTTAGTLNRFTGNETISLSDTVVYRCDYHGGIVA